MKEWLRTATALFLGYALSGALVGTRAEDSHGKLSKTSIAVSEAQTREIQKEIRQLTNHDWAGEYYFGDGLGVNVSLALAPASGFVFSWHGCLGLYDLNYGSVDFSNGTVKLIFKYPNSRKGFQGMASEFLPVRWGDRHYLIPLDEMMEFTNAINAGTEPALSEGRSGRFLLRRGDEKKAVRGLPNLTAEQLSNILPVPVKTKISSVLQTRFEKSRRITYVALGAGTAEGLKKGMELYVHNPSTVYAEATVTAVDEHTSRAVIEQEEFEQRDPAPSVGWRLSTKLTDDSCQSNTAK